MGLLEEERTTRSSWGWGGLGLGGNVRRTTHWPAFPPPVWRWPRPLHLGTNAAFCHCPWLPCLLPWVSSLSHTQSPQGGFWWDQPLSLEGVSPLDTVPSPGIADIASEPWDGACDAGTRVPMASVGQGGVPTVSVMGAYEGVPEHVSPDGGELTGSGCLACPAGSLLSPSLSAICRVPFFS